MTPASHVPLLARDGTIRGWALVSPEDADRVLEHTWRLHTGTGYARRSVGRAPIYLHRWLMGLVPGDGLEVDHENRCKLDCRRRNLRVVTRAQNGQNVGSHRDAASEHRGVRRGGRGWRAEVYVAGHRYYLGMFTDELDAARAAEAARAELMTHAA